MSKTTKAILTNPQIRGASYSVYVRIVLLALMEKQVEFNLQEIDIFDKNEIYDDYLKINPFGKIPTFTHGDLTIYETSAITRYIDSAFKGTGSLFPTDIQQCAKVNQIMSILDNYAYRTLVWDIFVGACEAETPDQAKIAEAIPIARTCLQALEDITEGAGHLVGTNLTMADIYGAPMFNYLMKSPQGQEMLPNYPKLARWWQSMQANPNCQKLFADD